MVCTNIWVNVGHKDALTFCTKQEMKVIWNESDMDWKWYENESDMDWKWYGNESDMEMKVIWKWKWYGLKVIWKWKWYGNESDMVPVSLLFHSRLITSSNSSYKIYNKRQGPEQWWSFQSVQK